MTIAEQLRTAILAAEAAGTSRYFICKETRTDQSHMSRFMTGKGGMSVEKIEQIAAFLGYEFHMVWKGNG